MSNQRKRVNDSGEEKVAILRAHFVEGLDSPRGKESRNGKGFVQPLTAHEHWHIDVADINIAGTSDFMAKLGEHELTADGRFSEPHCAGLRPAQLLPSAATPASVRSKPANPFSKTC